MVSVPAASVARGPGSSPGLSGLGTLCCVLAKTLYSHRCLSPPRCINAGGGGGVTLRWTSISSRGSRYTSSR